MLGPEIARVTIAAWLSERLPARLELVRQRLDTDWPADPKKIALVDTVSPDEALRQGAFPLLLVTTHELSGWAKHTSWPNIGNTWTCRYDVTIGVLVDSPSHGDLEGACIGRDRIVLAIRELLLWDGTLARADDGTPTAWTVLTPYTEETGPLIAAAGTLQGRPLAAAEIKFAIEQLETLDAVPARATFQTAETAISSLP